MIIEEVHPFATRPGGYSALHVLASWCQAVFYTNICIVFFVLFCFILLLLLFHLRCADLAECIKQFGLLKFQDMTCNILNKLMTLGLNKRWTGWSS